VSKFRSLPRGGMVRKRTAQSLARYGLTVEQYEAMENEIDGLCPLCFRSQRLVVDHCHGSGKVRGLICRTCNTGIGLLRDSPGVLARAAHYLAAHYGEPE
jgi:hypothetical protein